MQYEKEKGFTLSHETLFMGLTMSTEQEQQNDPVIHNIPIPPFLYGTAWKEDDTQTHTYAALMNGFVGVDTANQRKHYNEAGVGEGLKAFYDTSDKTRSDLYLQSKFTYQRGQDHRLPYDPSASDADQVYQSFKSSLKVSAHILPARD